MKKIFYFLSFCLIAFLTSCSVFKHQSSLSQQEWEKYSQEAMNILVEPFNASNNTPGGYVWPFLIYYPSLPPIYHFRHPYPGLVLNERTFIGLPTKLNDELKLKLKLYDDGESFITDTATVIICSPLLSTNKKNHFLVRQYVFHGNPKENARFSRTLTRKFVIKNGVLMLESGDAAGDLNTSADETSIINYDYFCK